MPVIEARDKKSIISEEDMQKIRSYVTSIQYGSITLIIQEGKIVQVEKNEKIKLK